jgi:NAD(P)-dependent dehydrogenase (short-subunit alcohol dehydrogenase family)
MVKKALITGGADPLGIGWASAVALAADDFEVMVTGISTEEIQRTPDHPRIRTAVLDVRDDAAVVGLLEKFDRLDALVNCAGTADPRSEFTPEGFSRTLDINLTGTMRCCLAARALLAMTKGAIVNVASMYALFGSSITPGYSASKAGVVQLTKSLAVAWAAQGIRVNAVAPGWIKTGMARAVWEDPVWAPAIAARTPMGRFGDPAELAGPIRFLCSHEARFVTGVLLPVDGGYSVSG